MKLLVSLLFFITSIEVKIYVKNFYPNGNLKEEGWFLNNEKTDYWFFYYQNGSKKAEGHFTENKRNKWWIFYDENEEVIRKSEYKNDLLNGFSLIYLNNQLIKVEKYQANFKIKDWKTIESFKKDNL